MNYISYTKLWESEFENIASKKDKIQDLNIKKIKFEVQDNYKNNNRFWTYC